MDEEVRNFFVIEHFLDEDFARLSGWEILGLEVFQSSGHLTKDVLLVDVVHGVVLDLLGGVLSSGFNESVHVFVFWKVENI